ncbi:cysteine desulfurase family protein [uncultured Sneathiella sp.]|uniref:cysteine desulfurase family protein n=1 Tax=uncultured Sneathiella sp. TaxID=879315 RepID=UPI0030EC9976|tara:strand:- start:60904 stop:62136 length:1233 start_codon:yes stop_codon:yes gene_type:complete
MIFPVEHHRQVSFEGSTLSLPIYLDYPASTPLDDEVAAAMVTAVKESSGNPHSSTHHFGHQARHSIEQAQAHIAKLIHARPHEIIFTSGATEANNLALLGFVRAASGARHVISVETEHEAVLQPLKYLSKHEGIALTLMQVDENGLIDLKDLEKAIRPETILVSVMAVNNETGVRQDISSIGRICAERNIAFHCDAAQALVTERLDVIEDGITLLSLSGHKIYGPMGIGALYIKEGTKIAPLFHGGGQQRDLRPGTLPTALCVGLGEACRIANENRERDAQHVGQLRTVFIDALRKRLGEEFRLNGNMAPHIPGCISMTFVGLDAEDLLHELPDLALSTGSACGSMKSESSHVLRAMGLSAEEVAATVRMGIGRPTSFEDVQYAAQQIAGASRRTRKSFEGSLDIRHEGS